MLRRAWGAGWWGQLMWWGMRACLEGRPKPDEDLEGCWSGWPATHEHMTMHILCTDSYFVDGA
eukprot:scaffold97228_cov18-Tisochrysis_lutea.AAC.1